MDAATKDLTSPFKHYLKKALHFGREVFTRKKSQETDALYRLLYQLVHDKEHSMELSALQTKQSFEDQWRNLREGNALLSDLWFKKNVARILCEEELLLKPEWFKGKEILDAGCGNGRWSFGLAQLGAHVTAVDINPIALEATQEALDSFDIKKQFIESPLETLDEKIGEKQFDLVFSWGVLHHCKSFNKSLKQLSKRVKDGGVIYLYLYGRESLPFEADVELFKERISYNSLLTSQDKMNFLLKKSGGDLNNIHIKHDLYAPLINRRLHFDEVKSDLAKLGFSQIERTIQHAELFVRATKGELPLNSKWTLPPATRPYWFERYNS